MFLWARTANHPCLTTSGERVAPAAIDVTLTYVPQFHRSLSFIDGNKFFVSFAPNYNFGTLIHELGHGWGLGDTYDERTVQCREGQPESLMCHSQNARLLQDGVDGIRARYAQQCAEAESCALVRN